MICRSAARVGRAEGPECESLGWNAVEAQETRPNKLSPPCKGRTNCDETTSRSIPCTSFVQWFAVLFAKSPVFGREIFLRMMLRLPADIFANHFDVRTTDAEFSVAGLPREISIPGILCFDPTSEEDLTCSTILAGAWFLDCANRIWTWSRTELISMRGES